MIQLPPPPREKTSPEQEGQWREQLWRRVTGEPQISSETTTYTAEETDDGVLADASGGAFTGTLYTPANAGRGYYAANVGSSGNFTLSPASGTIGGYSTLVLAPGDSAEIVFDGTNWQIRSWNYKRQVEVGTAQTSNGSPNSASWATFTNTPTLTLIPRRTAYFKVGCTFIAYNSAVGTTGFRIEPTAGSPTTIHRQSVSFDHLAAGPRTPMSIYSILSLTKGTTYSFAVWAYNNSGSATTFNSAEPISGVALVAEELY